MGTTDVVRDATGCSAVANDINFSLRKRGILKDSIP